MTVSRPGALQGADSGVVIGRGENTGRGQFWPRPGLYSAELVLLFQQSYTQLRRVRLDHNHLRRAHLINHGLD